MRRLKRLRRALRDSGDGLTTGSGVRATDRREGYAVEEQPQDAEPFQSRQKPRHNGLDGTGWIALPTRLQQSG